MSDHDDEEPTTAGDDAPTTTQAGEEFDLTFIPGELPAVTELRRLMRSADPIERWAAQAAYGVYCDAVRKGQVCPTCGWNYSYHWRGTCPTPEEQATIRQQALDT